MVFKSQYSNHYCRKTGCPNCEKSGRLTQDNFIDRANTRHNFKYDYSKTEYKNNREKITVICPIHGEFSQVAKNHLDGYGCAECGLDKAKRIAAKNGGWSRTRFKDLCKETGEAILYVIHCLGEDERFYKIGITSRSVDQRFKKTGYMPYPFTKNYEVKGNPEFIYDLEVRLHALLKRYKYNPAIDFHGSTECFTTIKPIEPLLKDLTKTDQLQLIA